MIAALQPVFALMIQAIATVGMMILSVVLTIIIKEIAIDIIRKSLGSDK